MAREMVVEAVDQLQGAAARAMAGNQALAWPAPAATTAPPVRSSRHPSRKYSRKVRISMHPPDGYPGFERKVAQE
jgi:hypothetical protein